ncbi:hypothetical protein [Flavobacterium sp. 5]|nr:hypothetical protein [Flavobacterium sp. 5]
MFSNERANQYYETGCPSPDGNGILSCPSLGQERYSGQQEIAPK